MRDNPAGGYQETAEHMLGLASEQLGFLGFESVRENLGITIYLLA
ncbi:MAG: hypothetical protein M2R45_02128 [Verrucomicrobia subdivision 3 bacterium]|nr:hypothetical protein [Limisphaerales bacterium]MCS1413815.1 hypothetical protein [Limisphaerales bacterium]